MLPLRYNCCPLNRLRLRAPVNQTSDDVRIRLTFGVVGSDLDDLVLQNPGLLVLLHVLLSLQPGRGVQHHVLDLALDVLGPRREPRHLGDRREQC